MHREFAVAPTVGMVLLRRLLVLAAMVLVARGVALGYPDYHVDETFYLTVGDAMRHGALPYVDIWDRKPLGLFLFYEMLAAIAPTVWTYQIVAIGFVTATAMLVTSLARRWSDEAGAVLAGAFYIAWLQPLGGGGGQSPVFYTLFVVGAVWLFVRSLFDRVGPVDRTFAICAALLCGLAVWFKPTAVCEGAFVVLGFAWLEWRRRGQVWPALQLLVAMGVVAAVPMLGSFAWYAVRGHFSAMWQATVLSNFEKTPDPWIVFGLSLRYFMLLTGLLWACAALGAYCATDRRYARLVLGWAAAAFAGFLVVPNFYTHYALPLVPIAAIMAAPYFSERPLGRLLAVFAIVWALYVGQSFSVHAIRQASERYDRMVEVVRANMPHGTLYIYKGSAWVYHETGARRMSRFVFPQHLEITKESSAIGVNPQDELRAILRQHPDVIMTEDNLEGDYNRQTFPILMQVIDRDYTLVCALPGRYFGTEFHYVIFARTRNPDRSHCLPGSSGAGDLDRFRRM
jgi:hypothetical protein